jgi:hypothetical protein
MPHRRTDAPRKPGAEGRAALAALRDFSFSFECLEVKRSTGDARLRLPSGAAAPDEFWLVEIDRGIAYRATTMWRRFPNVGVRLTEPIKLDRAAGYPVLTALWRAAAGGGGATERRQSVRARSRAAGTLFMADDEMTAECIVRNISAGGAKVRVSSAVRLTHEVGLLLVHRGVYFEAELVWRASDEAGIAFRGWHRLKGSATSRLEQANAISRRARSGQRAGEPGAASGGLSTSRL